MDFCHKHKIIPKTKLVTYKELDKVNCKLMRFQNVLTKDNSTRCMMNSEERMIQC